MVRLILFLSTPHLLKYIQRKEIKAEFLIKIFSHKNTTDHTSYINLRIYTKLLKIVLITTFTVSSTWPSPEYISELHSFDGGERRK